MVSIAVSDSSVHPSAGQKHAASGQDPAAEIAKLREDLHQAQTELVKMREIAARAQADLQNAKSRMQRDREEIGAFAVEAIVQRLLPIVDHFQRAVAHLPEDLRKNEWVKGIVAVEQDLLRVLHEIGLERMSSLGQVADPAHHEVVATGSGEQGKIIEVVVEGYLYRGRVLRPAKVRAGDGSMIA